MSYVGLMIRKLLLLGRTDDNFDLIAAAKQGGLLIDCLVMSAPVVVELEEGSPAHQAGLAVGDTVVALNGQYPRDVIEWQRLVDEPDLELEIDRGGLTMTIEVEKRAGQPLGIDVDAALFDRVRTCDNHCDFCFIYQLPKGMRRTLYLKDDDYRLSFLYGNFTTLTRFTEADLERVITERLSPLYVSIHATDPDVRTHMLRNKRGAMSLRWLEAILDADIEVHGQIVCCPDVNNGGVLEQTLSGVLDRYEKLASIAVVPLGVSKFSPVDHMRPHTVDEARDVVDIIERWQTIFKDTLGHRMVFAADEYYLRADLPFPSADSYDDVDLHEDGIGMAVTFGREFRGETDEATSTASGFFSWVEGAPAEGYRAPRTADGAEGTAAAPAIAVTLSSRPKKDRPIAVLTGTLGAQIIEPLIAASEPQAPTRVIAVENEFFGGNVGVTGLMVGADLQRVLAGEPEGDRYLLPDVCLSNGRFLDGLTVDDLPRPVEVITTDGISLRKAIGA
ncbi:MAG: putative radical SAM enzyme (TIGR03279 family) [Acidimicrobiales bacterium]|jgi:putative radical SAM enzyme (TIGR03279 family)